MLLARCDHATVSAFLLNGSCCLHKLPTIYQWLEKTCQDRHDTHNTVIVKDALHTDKMCCDMQTQPAGTHANHNTRTTACHYTGNTWLAINSLHAMAMTAMKIHDSFVAVLSTTSMSSCTAAHRSLKNSLACLAELSAMYRASVNLAKLSLMAVSCKPRPSAASLLSRGMV